MGVFDSTYFRINKSLMTGVGLWPYQDPRIKFYTRTFLFLGIVVMILSQLMALYKDFHFVDKVIGHFSLLFLACGVFLKFLTTIFAENKLNIVLDNIANNWEKITDIEERGILIEHSERGRQLTIGYIIYVMTALITFVSLPLMPLVLNRLKPLNESRPLLFILGGEFGVDRSVHYGKIYAVDFMLSSITIFVIAAGDTMYAVCIEHCVGLFSIVKFRLHTATKFVGHIELKCKDDSYNLIIKTIQLHDKIIKLRNICNLLANFANILESSYSTSFFFLMGINMFIFSITTVLVLIKIDQIMEFIRYNLFLIGTLVHLFYVSWPGQKLIDYSSGLFEDSYTNEWYECSIKTQELLKFITLRCLKPCQLTAGGLYVMNFANFLSIIKASMSYITMFSSFR